MQIQLDDFIKFNYLSSLNYSPCGKHLAFVNHKASYEDNSYLSNIYIKKNGGELIRLTSMDKESNFVWLDSDNIIFQSKRKPKEKEKEKTLPKTIYYKININGGEATEYFTVPLSANSIIPVDDVSFLITASYNPKLDTIKDLPENELKNELEKLKEEDDYEVLDEIPFWTNGLGFTNKIRSRLYLFNKVSKKLTEVTDDISNLISVNISKDKTKALIISESFTDKMSLFNDIFEYDIKENRHIKISPYENFSYSDAFYLEDGIIFSGTDMKKYGVNENLNFYFINSTKEVKRISDSNFDSSLYGSVGSDSIYGSGATNAVENKKLYFITTDAYNSNIHSIDKFGHEEIITQNKGAINMFSVKDDKISFIGLRDMKLQELYELKNGEELQLTSFNEEVYKNLDVQPLNRIDYKKHGYDYSGWVILPRDFDETKKYPGILDIHGGPKTVYGEVYFHEMQLWANMGYFVFFTNPKGSDGYGNEFSDIRGKYGEDDYEDLLNFTDMILSKYPSIDNNKLGVTGGSYGGFMTNWIIGHTDKFACAASQRSISNWISKFGTTDIGYFFVDDQNSATPWSNMEKLWYHSPLKYADKVKTPTLFIHSEEDYRCWLPEGLQMFTALKYHNIESRFCMFRGENHELSRSGKPKHRIRRLKEITDWFEKYLK